MILTTLPKGSFLLGIFLLALVPAQSPAQLAISNSEGQSVKFGFEGQFWAGFQQDLPQGYQQNLYLRRMRLIAAGQLAKDVTFFFETDQPNLGKNPKSLNAGFLMQDAFLEYRIVIAFRLDGGLMVVPLSRNTLQSTTSYYTLDLSRLPPSTTPPRSLRACAISACRLGVFSQGSPAVPIRRFLWGERRKQTQCPPHRRIHSV